MLHICFDALLGLDCLRKVVQKTCIELSVTPAGWPCEIITIMFNRLNHLFVRMLKRKFCSHDKLNEWRYIISARQCLNTEVSIWRQLIVSFCPFQRVYISSCINARVSEQNSRVDEALRWSNMIIVPVTGLLDEISYNLHNLCVESQQCRRLTSRAHLGKSVVLSTFKWLVGGQLSYNFLAARAQESFQIVTIIRRPHRNCRLPRLTLRLQGELWRRKERVFKGRRAPFMGTFGE